MLSWQAELSRACVTPAVGRDFMDFLSGRPAFYQRLDGRVPTIPPLNLESRMDFIFVALVAAFWAAIALMARGCDALQGRRPGGARLPQGPVAATASGRVLP
jgi:hypothetical protein